MSRPDRSAWARTHARWLIAGFALILLWGLYSGNIFAIAGGAGGLGWVWAALRQE